jgi:hypothetical protein
VHPPNFAAKESKDGYIDGDHEATCDECGENFWMTMYVGNYDAYIEMENPEEISNVKIDEISQEELEYQAKQFEAISDNTHLFQTFKSGIDKLKKLNAINLTAELEYILKLQIYTGVISTMETFLSDAFINLTLADKKLIKKFVQSYPDFRQRRIEFRDIFEQYEKVDEIVKAVLLDIIYHDLRKVREMYRTTFEIDFPDLEKPVQCVLLRHDIVHRNGKTKNGEVLSINTEIVANAIMIVENFITDIAKKLDLAYS